jgi:redox-sensitive bicupin YhaK (pirin superfamily)
MVLLDRANREVMLEASSDATVLLLGGEPLGEPIVGHGPFVMNTTQEINQAITDFHLGKFGRMSH